MPTNCRQLLIVEEGKTTWYEEDKSVISATMDRTVRPSLMTVIKKQEKTVSVSFCFCTSWLTT